MYKKRVRWKNALEKNAKKTPIFIVKMPASSSIFSYEKKLDLQLKYYRNLVSKKKAPIKTTTN